MLKPRIASPSALPPPRCFPPPAPTRPELASTILPQTTRGISSHVAPPMATTGAKAAAAATSTLDKDAVPRHPVPRNPVPLSAGQEQQVRDLYYKRVRQRCADEIKGTADSLFLSLALFSPRCPGRMPSFCLCCRSLCLFAGRTNYKEQKKREMGADFLSLDANMCL